MLVQTSTELKFSSPGLANIMLVCNPRNEETILATSNQRPASSTTYIFGNLALALPTELDK